MLGGRVAYRLTLNGQRSGLGLQCKQREAGGYGGFETVLTKTAIPNFTIVQV